MRVSGEDGPVLMHATRAHLAEIGGPCITEVPENAGRFVLRKEDVAAWILKTAQQLEAPQNASQTSVGCRFAQSSFIAPYSAEQQRTKDLRPST